MNARTTELQRKVFVERLSELGFSQESFARTVGMSRNTVHRWASGIQIPKLTPSKTLLVCKALQWTLEDFASAFPESDDEQQKTPEY
jgi:DNA-binding transcriptional regulator YiaG